MAIDSAESSSSHIQRFSRWLLIDGNRLLITGAISVGFFAFSWWLFATGILAVGPRSPIQSILGSGVVAGLFSLISVTLAINQLISSRVFGSLDSLQKKMEGGSNLRDTISEIAEHPSPPVNVADFISFIGTTLQMQARQLANTHDHGTEAATTDLESYTDDLEDYAERIQRVSSDMPAETVISILAGPDFAYFIDQTDTVRSRKHEHLTAQELEILDKIATLLGAISVFRQYIKTISLHQELAQLSRQFIFVSFPAVLVAILVPLLYRTNPADVLTTYPLELIISLSLAIVLTPLVLLMAYMLRIATIFRYTVSVAPFTPPVEWPWTDEPN